MFRNWLWVLSVVALPALSFAAPATGIQFAWYWRASPGATAPQWNLRLVETQSGTTTQQTVALDPLDEATCRALVPQGYEAPPTWCGKATCPAGTTWCGQIACPAPGAYTAALQQGSSLPTNAVSFGIAADAHGCAITPYAQGVDRPSAPPGTPLAAGLPADTPPGSEVLPTELRLTDEEVETVTQEMAALDQQFDVLESTYQSALQTLTADYLQILTEARTQTQQGAWAKAEQAWTQAKQLQTQIYERTQAHWEHLYAVWQAWLTRLGERAMVSTSPSATTTGAPDATPTTPH